MAKVKDNVLGIFIQSISLYFSNFGSFLKYMLFPVFGQVLGLTLMLYLGFLYASNLPKLIVPGGLFDNFSMIFLVLFVILLPGILIFSKAFWDYLVAYGAINSMVDNLLKSGKVYDFHAHNEVIIRKTAKFVGLWILIGLFAVIAYIPLFWVIAGIFFVYFILIFQVFTFEPDKSSFGCFKKSFLIIKGNFMRTLGLMILIGGLSFWILPQSINILFEIIHFVDFLAVQFDPWINQLPINEINQLLLQTPAAYQITSLLLAKELVMIFLAYIVIGLTLPLRSICWALWYKNLNKAEMKLDKKLLARTEDKNS
jgi:hypothetical protein